MVILQHLRNAKSSVEPGLPSLVVVIIDLGLDIFTEELSVVTPSTPRIADDPLLTVKVARGSQVRILPVVPKYVKYTIITSIPATLLNPTHL